MADNELQSLSFANSANKVDSPQIKAQKDTGKELKIKPPEINIQSAQQIVDGVSITPQEGCSQNGDCPKRSRTGASVFKYRN